MYNNYFCILKLINMNGQDFIGNLSYYGKKVKDFLPLEKKLFTLDNLLMLCLIEQKLNGSDFLGYVKRKIQIGILGKDRFELTCQLLNVTDDDKEKFSHKELLDMSENSDYSFSKFQDSHLKQQDDLINHMKEHPEFIMDTKEEKDDNPFPFSMN